MIVYRVVEIDKNGVGFEIKNFAKKEDAEKLKKEFESQQELVEKCCGCIVNVRTTEETDLNEFNKIVEESVGKTCERANLCFSSECKLYTSTKDSGVNFREEGRIDCKNNLLNRSVGKKYDILGIEIF